MEFVIMALIVLVATIIVIANRTYRSEREGHQMSAMNCKFWYGDNGFVDWGECSKCPPEEP